MRNYRISIDLSDVYNELIEYNVHKIGYTLPFSLVFIEANDPDQACYLILVRLINHILNQRSNIETRILCRKVKRLTRIDKIESL